MRDMVNELDWAVEFYTKCPYLSFCVMTPLRPVRRHVTEVEFSRARRFLDQAE